MEKLKALYSQLKTKVYLHKHTNQEFLTIILIAGYAQRERERKYVNCRATVYTLPVNICRFFIPTFHKNFHPNRWNVFFIKILLFQSLSRLKLFLDYGKLLHRPLPPKNIKTKKQKNGNCFSNNKLSISNKESYLARPKQSREFHKIICRFCV